VVAVSPPEVPAVSAADVAGDAFLLDVREPEEWVAGHAPTAVHLPMGSVVAQLADVPTDREVVVVCRSGVRSAQVTGYLNRVGRRALNLDGGMQAWAAAGRPMVSETGAAPVVA
jgi:rhodanese-related sulfurtransferase